MTVLHLCAFLFTVCHIHGLTLSKEHAIYDPHVQASINDDCDPSTIPVMNSFDIKKVREIPFFYLRLSNYTQLSA
ncbi:hypothetical protein TNIN_451541 [Trichonephila inaurata madagascariensis]|uniref:Uncharacterized protein n=1 Tax=Trichonephila inaurata madagascariensis TaxID=2747483 RepID=A0A8X6XD35_9ARAC|nr:hypothetical protein TNIN_451541 [Trichonephila inaurata madagascariensis]